MFPQQQRFVLKTYFETKNHRNIIVNLFFFLYMALKKTQPDTQKKIKNTFVCMYICVQFLGPKAPANRKLDPLF